LPPPSVAQVNPSGRLAQNWVRHVGAIRGPANPWFQQRNFPSKAYVTEPDTALFPFGYGLSYATFNVTALAAPSTPLSPGSTFTVTVTVSSTGAAGKAVVQVYFSQDAPTKYVRYEHALLCYAKVALPANSPPTPVPVTCAVDDMAWFDPDVNAYVVFPGAYTVYAGTSSDAAALQQHTAPVQVAAAT
jgi:beta-glucosidase